jgi:hypothetical protein
MQEFKGLIVPNKNFRSRSDSWRWYDVVDKKAVPRGHDPAPAVVPAVAPAELAELAAEDALTGIFQEALDATEEEERPAQQLSIFSIFHKSSYPL